MRKALGGVGGIAERVRAGLELDLVLDRAHDLLGFEAATVHGQPARAFRQISAQYEERNGQGSRDREPEPPGDVRIEFSDSIEHDRKRHCQCGTDPPDGHERVIQPGAHPRRDELIDGARSRRILAAEPDSRDRSSHNKGEATAGERCRDHSDDVDHESQFEHFAAPDSLAQIRAGERRKSGASEVTTGSTAEGDVRHAQRVRTSAEKRTKHASKRDVEAIQQPGESEQCGNEGVPA